MLILLVDIQNLQQAEVVNQIKARFAGTPDSLSNTLTAPAPLVKTKQNKRIRSITEKSVKKKVKSN